MPYVQEPSAELKLQLDACMHACACMHVWAPVRACMYVQEPSAELKLLVSLVLLFL